MDTFSIVRQEHLNHHGYLFGGFMLKWVDEFAWIVASREYRGCTLVTLAMEKSLFKHRVINGAILRFAINKVKEGRTSVCYAVEVFADIPGGDDEIKVFSTQVVFVRVNEAGEKIPLDDK